MKKKILYVSGTRADFGLMRLVLRGLKDSPTVELGLLICGAHFSGWEAATRSGLEEFQGNILRESHYFETGTDESSRAFTAHLHEDINRTLLTFRPEIMLVLGDRIEALLVTMISVQSNIPVIHIHGGERSGSLDDSYRHAISKLAHRHLVATDESRDRLIKMGEHPQHIMVTGAPGIEDIPEIKPITNEKMRELNFPLGCFVLVLLHPVPQQQHLNRIQMEELLKVLKILKLSVVMGMPNMDLGGDAIRHQISSWGEVLPNFVTFEHLRRVDYIGLLKRCSFMISNSSSGIIESASCGKYVINLGDRQRLRERNANILDSKYSSDEILKACQRVRSLGPYTGGDKFYQPYVADKICQYITDIESEKISLEKINAY